MAGTVQVNKALAIVGEVLDHVLIIAAADYANSDEFLPPDAQQKSAPGSSVRMTLP